MAFWGLVLEPKKTYTQREVEQPFHISMATLDLANCDSAEDSVSVICRKQDADFILCNLSKKRGVYNVPLNLDFELGGEISFHLSGNSTVHLTGFMIEDHLESFEESDDSLEEEEDVEENRAFLKPATKKLLEGGKRKPEESPDKKSKKPKVQLEEEDDDDEDEDDSDFDMNSSGDEEVEEEEEEDDDDEDDEEEDDENDDAAEVLKKIVEMKEKSKQPKQQGAPIKPAAKASPKGPAKVEQNQQNAKQGKKDKKEQGKNQPLNKSNGTQPSNGLMKRSLQGGVFAEDLVVGTGPVAKQGSNVAVYYVGRLKSNNKQFDSTQSGQGFKFRVGRGEVIKGWDVGVQGMKVGGKRRLVIPPKMAYGDQGAGGGTIPPNAALLFDVELRHVK